MTDRYQPHVTSGCPRVVIETGVRTPGRDRCRDREGAGPSGLEWGLQCYQGHRCRRKDPRQTQHPCRPHAHTDTNTHARVCTQEFPRARTGKEETRSQQRTLWAPTRPNPVNKRFRSRDTPTVQGPDLDTEGETQTHTRARYATRGETRTLTRGRYTTRGETHAHERRRP